MELQQDEITVDTSLAQVYLQENTDVLDLFENYDSRSTKEFNNNSTEVTSKSCDVLLANIRALTSNLKQNEALITQLEYHIRNIPIEDTRNQLNLIIQNLNCHELRMDYLDKINSNIYCFGGSLLNFRTIVQMLMYCTHSVIILNVSKTTAVITQFFLKLCQDAGFNNVELLFLNTLDVNNCDYSLINNEFSNEEIKGLDSGTVAVVCEDADVDSAVDTLLLASEQAPWRLRKILVQESVYQQFKDALSWKCNMKQQEKTTVDSDILCSDTLTYNGKSFLIDPVDLPADQPVVVTVEAYRTKKEMMALVQSDKARYLSLWANDIAEINEITHGTKTPVVWVNNIADFRGPPQVSDAVFTYALHPQWMLLKCEKVAKLCEQLRVWLKLDYGTRCDILCDVLDRYMKAYPAEDYAEMKSAISAYPNNSFVDVGKDYICVGIWEPVGVIFSCEEIFSLRSLKSILDGNGFVIYEFFVRTEGCNLKYKCDLLKEAGVPVAFIDDYELGEFVTRLDNDDHRVRVIWTNKGTIFAN